MARPHCRGARVDAVGAAGVPGEQLGDPVAPWFFGDVMPDLWGVVLVVVIVNTAAMLASVVGAGS